MIQFVHTVHINEYNLTTNEIAVKEPWQLKSTGGLGSSPVYHLKSNRSKSNKVTNLTSQVKDTDIIQFI